MTSSKMAAKMAAILDLLKIQICRENEKIAIYLLELYTVIELNILLLLVAFYMFSFDQKMVKKSCYL